MSEVLDRVENRGCQAGLAEGRREGRREGHQTRLREGELMAKKEIAHRLYDKKYPVEEIAEAANVSVDTVKQCLAAPLS